MKTNEGVWSATAQTGKRRVVEDASYRITNKKRDQWIQVRAANADDAVHVAMQKRGPEFFGFPLVVHNLDTDRAVIVMNDQEYEKKVPTVDKHIPSMTVQPLGLHHTQVRHSSEDDLTKWKQRVESSRKFLGMNASSLSEDHTEDLVSDANVLDAPTLNVQQIAVLHGVSDQLIQSQLTIGIGVELEHTTNVSVAREIALDHLAEDPQYYTKLRQLGI